MRCLALTVCILNFGCKSLIKGQRDIATEMPAESHDRIEKTEELIIQAVSDIQRIRNDCLQLTTSRIVQIDNRVTDACNAKLGEALAIIQECQDNLEAEKYRMIRRIRGGARE